MSKHRLWYHMENDGAGGAFITFHPSEAAARDAEENAAEPFADQTAASLDLEISDGRVFAVTNHVGERLFELKPIAVRKKKKGK